MTDPWLEEWLQKAEQDYRAASSLDPESTPEVICFHCQQCVEKYLKAAMVVLRMDPPATHDLVALNSTLRGADDRFGTLADSLPPLNPYAVLARYPGFDASPEDARQAVQIMQELRTQIREFLSLDAE